MQPLELKSHPLTKFEKRICDLVLQGATNREISGELGVQYQVVKNHLTLIYNKLRVRDRVQLIVHYGKGKGRRLL